MNNLLYCIVFLYFLFCSCTNFTNKNADENTSTISVSMINNSLLKLIDDYCRDYPDYNSILILSDIDENWNGGYKYENYWIIGPAYKGLGHPSLFFKYKNVMVFLQSSLDGLTDSTYSNKTYRSYSINEFVNVKKDREGQFYDNAIICEHNNEGEFHFVSNRLDTFFMKNRVDFVVPPIK